MPILSSIPSDLGFWSETILSIHENSESNVFEKIKFLGEISNNWLKDSLGTNVY